MKEILLIMKLSMVKELSIIIIKIKDMKEVFNMANIMDMEKNIIIIKKY